MQRHVLGIAFTFLAGAAALSHGQPAARTIAITGVAVVPMDRERVLADHTVLVVDGRIGAVGPSVSVSVPDGATRIDGRGQWLMPGLAEMHAHIPPGNASIADMERMLELNLLNGITVVRGMLGDPRHLTLRDRAARGELPSPHILTSGPSFNGNSAPSPEAATKMVADQKAAGYDLLKIHPGVPRAAFDALAEAAGKAGLRFSGHVPLDVGLARALEARFETIDHVDGYVEAMVRDEAPVKATASQWFGVNLIDHVDESRIPALVEKTRAAGTWIVPTQTLFESTVGPLTAAEMSAWPEMKWVSAAQVEQWTGWKEKFVAGGTTTPASRAKFLELRRRLIKALHDGGVGLLLGADAPQMWNVPGFATHRELQAMVAAGLTPYQALSTGTRNVAQFMGALAERGTIEPGKRADLVLLSGNPLQDIANTTRITGVMRGTRWLARADIDARLAALAVR